MHSVDHGDYEALRDAFVAARERVALAEHHTKRIPQLEEELAAEQVRHEALERALAAEQRDVEKLDRFSFQKLRAKLGQGVEEARERELLEAQAAADAVIESSEHMAGVRSEIKRLTTELDELDGAAETAEAARFELETCVRRTFPGLAERLGALDNDIAALRSQIVEVEEAIAAGDFAVLEMKELIAALKVAKNLSNFDMFAGGMLVSMYKRDKIRVSSEKSRAASFALEIFDREAKDTSLSVADLGLDNALGHEVLDVWFDNFFTDMMIHGKLEEASGRAERVLCSITDAVGRLRLLKNESLASIEAIEQRRREVLAQRL